MEKKNPDMIKKTQEMVEAIRTGNYKIEKIEKFVLEILDNAKALKEALQEGISKIKPTTKKEEEEAKDSIKDITEIIEVLENAKNEIEKYRLPLLKLEKTIKNGEKGKRALEAVKVRPEEVREKLEMLAEIEKKITKAKELKAKTMEKIRQLFL